MYYYNNGNISKFERLVFSGIQKKNSTISSLNAIMLNL